MRQAAKRDANEGPIVSALQAVGAWVHRLDRPFDLLVHFRRQWFLLEVKQEAGRLTPAQRKALAEVGVAAVHIVKTPEEALRAIGCR